MAKYFVRVDIDNTYFYQGLWDTFDEAVNWMKEYHNENHGAVFTLEAMRNCNGSQT